MTKTPFWKKIKKEKERKKLLVFTVFFLSFFSLLFLTRILKNFARTLTTPLEPKECFASKTSISSANRIYFLLDFGNLLLISFDKEKKEIEGILLPGNFYLQKEGEVYRLGAFFELGKMKSNCGGRFLKREIEGLLSLPVDRYLKFKETETPSLEDFEEIFLKIKSYSFPFLFFKNFFLKKKIETDLSFWEILQVWWQVRKVRRDKVWFFVPKNISFSYLLPDRTKIEVVDRQKILGKLQGRFEDEKMKKERVEVAVLNTTGKRGKAKEAGKMIENLGGNLVHIGNYPLNLKENQIWIREARYRNMYTTRRLGEIFQAQVFLKKNLEERGEVLLLLGEK